jgi:hypothetical protein
VCHTFCSYAFGCFLHLLLGTTMDHQGSFGGRLVPPRTMLGVFHLKVFREIPKSGKSTFLMFPVTSLEEISWTPSPNHRFLKLTGFLNSVQGVGGMGANHWVNHLRSFEEFTSFHITSQTLIEKLESHWYLLVCMFFCCFFCGCWSKNYGY